MVVVTNASPRPNALPAVLLVIEVPLLLMALLVVHYGGIPFGLSTYQPGWCFDHGLPGRELSGGDDVRIDHTLWPLGITCAYAANTVRFPDWAATFRNYGFLAAVIIATVVTVTLMWRHRRRGSSWSSLPGDPKQRPKG